MTDLIVLNITQSIITAGIKCMTA